MMNKNVICDAVRAQREYGQLIACLEDRTRKESLPALVTGLSQGSREAFVCAFVLDCFERRGGPALILVPEEREFAKFANVLESMGIKSSIYPSRELNFHNITASHDYEHERLSVLCALSDGEFSQPFAVLATPDAALGYTAPQSAIRQKSFELSFGQSISIDALTEALIAAGYVREDMVNGPGQFSRRGYIVDIFSPLYKNPHRVEFFDEEIDQISVFDVITQRRIENAKQMKITPAREILLDADTKQRLLSEVRLLLKRAESEDTRSELEREAEAIISGTDLNFLDKYLSFIYPQRQCLLDYFRPFADSCVIALEQNALRERVSALEWQLGQTVEGLLYAGLIRGEYAEYAAGQGALDKALCDSGAVICDAFASGGVGSNLAGIFAFSCKYVAAQGQNGELLSEDVEAYIKNGFKILLLCESETASKNLSSMLAERGAASVITAKAELDISSMHAGVPYILHGYNYSGFELPRTKFVCISLFDRAASLGGIVHKRSRARRKKDVKTQILSYADLSVGDYVVHRAHGIGRYRGIKNIVDIYGISRDYIEIEYAGEDVLFIPCDQLEAISKYIGQRAEDGLVRLSKMGGAEWKKATARVKAAAREMAAELIALYAERTHREGFAFPPDDDFMREFEAAFEYEETEGQPLSVSQIKEDMERSSPMDRLLCGDVGFGKTEVAMRAAFKAVLAGKQVAILVPTTILALQHYQTVLARMRGFGVNVGALTRFQTPAQQQALLRAVKRGEIDVLIGTHRIISSDVAFADLGLVIIDEEQRFGVAQKEKLKQISKNVDVLTLTATPIPRTLNMAMSGIRDMSILDEAPEDRVPVQTYVLEYDDGIICEAIKKELRRGGQVFFLHNNVETIYAAAKRLSDALPEARVGVAHGKMDKDELSDIWQSMVMGEIDVLVSTTIIETGVDIPNANTLIIEFADRMGLSQLHQLRGRIGRSSRRAYAYFTFSRGKVLSEIATKRLQAIRDYTEFGSGFKIAMRDLEIRGAGNVLGAEQHGHMESVGYDLYIKILSEAILEQKGEAPAVRSECTVDLMCNAYLPKGYIQSEGQRIEFYKKIAAIETSEDFDDVCDEITDRFGDMPRSALNLLRISYLRALASRLLIGSIEQKQATLITLRPDDFNFMQWAQLGAKWGASMKISASAKPFITLKLPSASATLDKLEELLCDLDAVKTKFTN